MANKATAGALENLKDKQAQTLKEQEDTSGVGGDETVSEALSKMVFSSYVCRSVARGKPHPGDIAEPTSLRLVQQLCLCPPRQSLLLVYTALQLQLIS